MVPEKEKAAIPKKKDTPVKQQSVNPILVKYCKQEDIDLKLVLQKRSTSRGADAKRALAQAISDNEDMNYKAIAVIMGISSSSVWGYLYSDRNQDVRNDAIVRKVLEELPETYEKLLKIAKDELRPPLDQIRFIVREYCKEENYIITERTSGDT